MLRHSVIGILPIDARLKFKVVLIDGKGRAFSEEKAHYTNSLHINDAAGTDPRSFGICEYTTHCIFVAFNPEYLIRTSGVDQILDIISHEWGHAIAWATGFNGSANTEVLANYLGCILREHAAITDLLKPLADLFDSELLALGGKTRARHKYMGGN